MWYLGVAGRSCVLLSCLVVSPHAYTNTTQTHTYIYICRLKKKLNVKSCSTLSLWLTCKKKKKNLAWKSTPFILLFSSSCTPSPFCLVHVCWVSRLGTWHVWRLLKTVSHGFPSLCVSIFPCYNNIFIHSQFYFGELEKSCGACGHTGDTQKPSVPFLHWLFIWKRKNQEDMVGVRHFLCLAHSPHLE